MCFKMGNMGKNSEFYSLCKTLNQWNSTMEGPLAVWSALWQVHRKLIHEKFKKCASFGNFIFFFKKGQPMAFLVKVI